MMKYGISIAHISDLHFPSCSPGSRTRLITNLRSYLGKGSPYRGERNLLVVSGDLVDHPKPELLKEAAEYIEVLRCDLAFNEVFVVPGNHDYKNYGNYMPFWRVFLGKKESPFREALGAYRGVFPNDRVYSMQSSGKEEVVVFGYDSNSALFAKGRVSNEELFGKKDLAVKLINTENSEALRLGVLHHHPLPLLAGESDRIFGIEAESLAYMEHPAAFLDHCFSMRIRLILHGHRHGAGLRKFAAYRREGFSHEIIALACPSSTDQGEGCGFNLICLPGTSRSAEIYQVDHERAQDRLNGGDRTLVPRLVLDLGGGGDIAVQNALPSVEEGLESAVAGLLTAIGQGLWVLRPNSHPRICILRKMEGGGLKVDGKTAFNFSYFNERGSKVVDPDIELVLGPNVGVSARAMIESAAVFGHPSDGNLSPDQRLMVRDDRKCILSVPLFKSSAAMQAGTKAVSQEDIIGVLSLDSDLDQSRTGWNEGTVQYLARFVPTLSYLLSGFSL